MLSFTFLSSKFLYNRHTDIQPYQLLTLRGIISTIFTIALVNKDLKYVVWDSVKSSDFKNLMLRSGQGSLLILIQFSIVKYLSMIFIGLA
jgi:hypothetical protein